MELVALERLKNRRHHFFSVAIDPILFKLTGNEDMHNTELAALERRKKFP